MRTEKLIQRDRLWVLVLLLAAMLLYSLNLGGVALRDWDEGIVAQVARDIWRAPSHSLTWLHPTIAGMPYLNKPPLVHLLISVAYTIAGVNEWTTRLPAALLSAGAVPLLYLIGRELFLTPTPAIFSALVYLTCLPVARHSRLAMLDGVAVCFFLLMLWCLLRARRDMRWALGAGIGFSLICLTKGILGLLLAAIALLFLLWDTPRLFTSPYLWLGGLLGSLPLGFWYGAQWFYYQQQFGQNLLEQSISRVWRSVENNGGPPWYYLLEILKYSLPWLLFLPQGFHVAWESRNLSWAKLVMLWSGGYLLVISAMSTKLPWYVLPIYPALALVAGAQIARVWQWLIQPQLQPEVPLKVRHWVGLFALIALIGWGGSFYYGLVLQEWDIQLVLGAIALTMTVVAILLARRDPQCLLVLFWGCYVSLLLLMASSHWVWELAEHYPVKPVAALLQQATPAGQVIYTSYPDYRPSLDFYSDRRVIPASDLKSLWSQESPPYLLVDQPTLNSLALEKSRIVGQAGNWILITPSQK